MNQEDFTRRYKYESSIDRLGEGGFGEVFRAYDNFLDRWVALKISKVKSDFPELRLRNEVELVNKLPVHPNIARYEECYTFTTLSGDYDFAILQYYESGNLLQVIQKHDLSLSQKYFLLQNLLEGIKFIHSAGIIHRDLKPQNILVVTRNENYIPKITDFGISKRLGSPKATQFSNSLIGAGTITYSAPEQLSDQTIRKNTDLWSFGVIAFQILTGELPFNSGSHSTSSELGRQEMMKQINSGKLPESIHNVQIPWKQIVERCLEIDPFNRIQKVEDCLDILSGTKSSKLVSSTRKNITIEEEATQIASSEDNRFQKTQKRRNSFQKFVFVSFIAALIIGNLIFNHSKNNSTPTEKHLLQTDSTNTSPVQVNEKESISIYDSLDINTDRKSSEYTKKKVVATSTERPLTEGQIVFTNGNTYTGQILNGKMHGKGKYWFKSSGPISEDDPLERKAEAGDYLEGEWNKGDLYKGYLFNTNGVRKTRIVIGRN